MTLVGALGREPRARVDERGGVALVGESWQLDWWVGADDRWRFPAEEVALRQERVASMPVVRTALRVPGGDAVQRTFGAADGSIVVEVENDSPAAFALALVVRGARRVELEGATVLVDGRTALRTQRSPGRWAASTDGSTRDVVLAGGAVEGAFAPLRDRRGRIEVALLHPVAHRSTFRAVLVGSEGGPEAGAADPRALPTAEEAARGWEVQLDRGMRAELPDPRVTDALTAARAQAVLRASHRPDGDVVAALEGWGLDDDAALAWSRASLRERRKARRHAHVPARWPEPDVGAAFLRTARDLLAREDGRSVEILADLPDAWRGADLDVRDVPLRRGPLSYALRWHGDRPALLWEMPAGVRLRAPGLDPSWSTMATTGETLLGPPEDADRAERGRMRS